MPTLLASERHSSRACWAIMSTDCRPRPPRKIRNPRHAWGIQWHVVSLCDPGSKVMPRRSTRRLHRRTHVHLKRKLRGQSASAVRLAPFFYLEPHVVNLTIDNHFHLPAVRQNDRPRVVPVLISVGRTMQNLAVCEDDGSIKLAPLERITFLSIGVIPSIKGVAFAMAATTSARCERRIYLWRRATTG